MRKPLAFVLVLSAASMALRAAEPRTGAFAVGVMRRDGLVIPYAAFDGKRWNVAWSNPQVELVIPINLTSVPKLWWASVKPQEAWQLWLTSGGPQTVTVTQTDWAPAHCVRQVVLRTDYRSERPVPPLSEQPYPKDGLVVAPPQPVEPIEVLSVESPESRALMAVVTDAFDRAERELAQRASHPIKQDLRERVAVNIEAVYAFGSAPRMYYVESARGYQTERGEDQCPIAFGTGWFIKDAGGGLKKLDMAVDLLPCNKYGATYMLPFGVVHANGKAYWLAQFSGWDHERYMVVELKKNNVEAVVAAWGGGCSG